MIRFNQYAPILKGKEGEFIALSKLPKNLKELLVPIVDIVQEPNKTFEKHIQSTIGYFKKWDQDKLLYVDGYMVQEYEQIFSGQHYMQYIFSEMYKDGFVLIPVISNITNPDYNTSVKKIIRKYKKGICIRMFRTEMQDINLELDALLNYLEITPVDVDLILDLESVEEFTVDEIYSWSINKIAEIRQIPKYRSLVLSGSNFPINLIKLKADQIHIIQRKQWLAWQKLCNSTDIERLPSYSDYTISHPQLSEYGEGIPNPSASIRYTHGSDYIIYRGKGTRQHHFDQFYYISESLLNSDDFEGVDHCAGDGFIYECGTLKKKPGSMRTWRWVGTIHHLTVVINQLLQFFRAFRASRTS